MAVDLEDLDPGFLKSLVALRDYATSQGVPTHIISAFRTFEDQRQLYANYLAGKAGQPLPYPDRGAVPLAASPGHSAHESGFAADVAADDPSQQGLLRSFAPKFSLATIENDPDHFQAASWSGSSGSLGGSTVSAPSSTSPETGRFGYNDLVALAIKAGFPPDAAPTAAAISLAESSGNPGAHNVNKNGSEDFGLMQINSSHDGEFEGGAKAAYDPLKSMQMAHALFAKNGGFGDWATYNSGVYKKFLNGSDGGGPGTAVAAQPPSMGQMMGAALSQAFGSPGGGGGGFRGNPALAAQNAQLAEPGPSRPMQLVQHAPVDTSGGYAASPPSSSLGASLGGLMSDPLANPNQGPQIAQEGDLPAAGMTGLLYPGGSTGGLPMNRITRLT